MELLLSTQKDNIKQVSEINDEIKATLKENSQVNQQFESMIQKSKIVVQLIESVSNKFENNSNVLNESSSSLKISISNFRNSLNDYINRNNELLNYQQEVTQNTKKVSEIYSTRFETIEKGLTGIFDQIQTGLKDYQKTTGENLNQYLKQFSTILTAAHQGLENNVSGLNDIAEELTDQIEKLTRRR